MGSSAATDVQERAIAASALPASVCFVTSSFMMGQVLRGDTNDDVGGAEVQMCQIASLLTVAGSRVSCIVGDEGGGEDVTTADGIRVLTGYARNSVAGGATWIAEKWPALWSAMERADANVYITRGASWLAGAAAAFARLNGRRSIVWLASDADVDAMNRGGGLPVHARICWRQGVRWADAIVAQTAAQQSRMAAETGRVCKLVPNMWIAPGPQDALQVPEFDVLWVGNLRDRKRPMLALDVAERLPDLRFALVGGPVPGEEDLHAAVLHRASELGNVTCVGHVPHDQVHAYYRAASILLHTSAMEGFPNVFLEAWGEGLPVVSTFDPDDVIARHQLGRIAGSADQLADAVRDAVGFSKEKRREIAAWVRRTHGQDTVVQAIEDVLSSLTVDGAAEGRCER